LLERTTVHGAFCTSAVPGGASRARLPWQLRLRRRRAISAVGATPQLGLAAGLSARSTSSSVLGRQKSLCAKLEAEARAGERGALEVVVRNGELDGSAPSSNSSWGSAAPLPCDLQALTALKSTPLLPDCRTQVSAPWRPVSTPSRRRVHHTLPQARQHGQSVPRGAASTSELAARSEICDRFYPSSFSFSALTRRSPTLCARVQAASSPASMRGRCPRLIARWDRRLPVCRAILALARALADRSWRPSDAVP
jgi:hypothetical protein